MSKLSNVTKMISDDDKNMDGLQNYVQSKLFQN